MLGKKFDEGKMNLAYVLKDLRAIPLMHQLGYMNNKKPGQGLAEEAIEVAKRHPEWITILGDTNYDIDTLTGNLRESIPGAKILNVNEFKRQIENQNKDGEQHD